MPVNPATFDIVIVGAGLVGASLVQALAKSRFRVAVVEAVERTVSGDPGYDDRHLALSHSTQQILSDCGVWPALAEQTRPIQHIHVSDRGRPGSVRLSAGQLGLPALGHVITARELGRALTGNLSTSVTQWFCPARVTAIKSQAEQVDVQIAINDEEQTVTARLVILADGSQSATRALCGFETTIKRPKQTAIVCNVRTELPHNNTAFERFTEQGPFALLPKDADSMAMIFTVPTEQASDYLAMPDDQFVQVCQQQFGRRLGRLSEPGKRSAYAITMFHVQQQAKQRILLLGNSAHTLHPNAAQGFNLALRDVAGLANVLNQFTGDDVGQPSLLQQYEQARATDQKRTVQFTNTLADLFYTENRLIRWLRNVGMFSVQFSPVLKSCLSRQGTGLNTHYQSSHLL